MNRVGKENLPGRTYTQRKCDTSARFSACAGHVRSADGTDRGLRHAAQSGRGRPRVGAQDRRGVQAPRRRGGHRVVEPAADHTTGPSLVLVTHGSVVSDLTGLNVRM